MDIQKWNTGGGLHVLQRMLEQYVFETVIGIVFKRQTRNTMNIDRQRLDYTIR